MVTNIHPTCLKVLLGVIVRTGLSMFKKSYESTEYFSNLLTSIL